MKLKLPERRRFLRIDIPLKIRLISGDRVDETTTKNISPVGLRFELDRELNESKPLSISLYLPSSERPVHLNARVIWQTRTSLEDKAPYDIGAEITEIDDKDKNPFLKYLCDLLYSSTYKART
ncbi:MAG: hypothetical protein GF408_02285 [Candidatus Omnitrophica bacterium]|nr:hypothetical protein [Candidatus Omnitrophota bacterium]